MSSATPYVGGRYTYMSLTYTKLVFACTRTSAAARPTFSPLATLYSILTRRYDSSLPPRFLLARYSLSLLLTDAAHAAAAAATATPPPSWKKLQKRRATARWAPLA